MGSSGIDYWNWLDLDKPIKTEVTQMRTVKFQISEDLWERFYRAFPGHGERSNLLRRIVRHIIINKPQHTFFEEAVGDSVLKDMKENEDD